MLSKEFNIKDREITKAIDKLSQKAEQAEASNFVLKPKELTRADLPTLKEGVRYVDEDSSGNKRLVFKINGKLYKSSLTEIT